MTTPDAVTSPIPSSMPVHPSNATQRQAWDGDEGAYWASHADHFERALAAYHHAFFAAAAIRADHRVLDVGCGSGAAARQAARTAARGSVLGVDLSSALIQVARDRAAAEGLCNVCFEQADAQIHPFDGDTFDVALAQTSASFFGDRVAGLANVGRALRQGGRLVLLTWQPPAANEWISAFGAALSARAEAPAPAPPPPDAPGPFGLADPGRIRSVLFDAGYVDVVIDGLQQPMWFGVDAEDAQQFVLGLLGWMLDALDGEVRGRAAAALRATMAAHQTARGVLFQSAAWLTTATWS